MLKEFHFLEPLWFLALIPLAGLLWFAFKNNTDSKAWKKIIDHRLLPLLLQGEDKNTHKLPKGILAFVWLVAVIALADPVWEKIPRPVFQTNAARVLVLDLSNSMLIDDVKPSRLARARFKIEDILSREEEGQTGLVLFAGEAFVASPLTRDTETIRSILKVLTPQIMPAQGSRLDLGLIKAHELLKQSGIVNGQVLVIADGASQKTASNKAAEVLLKAGHTVSVMAVGTEAGGQLNFRNNTSRIIKLDEAPLSDIAKKGGGNYHLMTGNNTDLNHLLTFNSDYSALEQNENSASDKSSIQNTEWNSTGPWLVLLLLPFAALAFRKGWLLNLTLACLVFTGITPTQEVFAADDAITNKVINSSAKQTESRWQYLIDNLTKNKAQRASKALKNAEYENARDLSTDLLTRGSAEYKLGDYDAALESFKQVKGAEGRYNEANTLAKLNQYEQAIAAYDKALKLNPDMNDAKENKKAIEDFLKQQSSKDQQTSQQNQSEQQNQSQDNKEQTGGSDSKNEQNDSQASDKKGEQQEQNKSEENQFSEANNDLEKNKKEAEQEQVQNTQNEPSDADTKQENNDLNTDLTEQGSESKDEISAEEKAKKQAIKEQANELSKEEKMAAEQWLRRIPDDPGGLLMRKFRHQYNQSRGYSKSNSNEQPW